MSSLDYGPRFRFVLSVGSVPIGNHDAPDLRPNPEISSFPTMVFPLRLLTKPMAALRSLKETM